MTKKYDNMYSFVCGKNWKLSLAEVISYLETREFEFEICEISRTYFRIKLDRPLNSSVISDLGGILKIGQLNASIKNDFLIEAFLNDAKSKKDEIKNIFPLTYLSENISPSETGKLIFGVSVYWANSRFRKVANQIHRFIGSSIKSELKAQGKNARFMGFPKTRNNPQLTAVEVLKKGLIENNSEILLFIGEKDAYIGTSFSVHNPFEFQKRDMEKPVQRKIFAIPPRLARIMANLSHCTSGKVFLDPFCGVGTILLEALLLRAEIIGLDLNRWCVEASKRNLEWIVQEYLLDSPGFMVLQGDAKRLTSKIRDEIDCIATEPDLGPALKQIPTNPYASKIISKLTPLYFDFLREANKILKTEGFLVCVTPYIKTRSGKPEKMEISKFANALGLESCCLFKKKLGLDDNNPLYSQSSFIDVDEHHIVGREIHIFQKKSAISK